MKEEQFIIENSNTWKSLEELSNFINKKGFKALPSEDVKKFLHIFKQCSHHLAYARTHYPNSNLVTYLNSLVGKCNSYVYSVKKASPKQFFKYICYGFPKLLKEQRLFLLCSFGFFALGFIVSLLLVFYNVDNASFFLPQNLIEGAKAPKLGAKQWDYPLMSSYIMTNNIGVAIKATALGITLALGTIYVLFYNGALLGALTGLIYMYGNPINFWSLILPHGIIELTAIFISGAAGLIIAKNILIPGELTRKHALIYGAKQAITMLAGVIFMLIIAGIIEGFFTPLNIPEVIKLAFAAVTAVLLVLYFSIPYLVKETKA